MKIETKSLLYVHIAVLLFGLAGLFGKAINLPASIITLGRVFFAAVALFTILTFTKQSIKLDSKKDYLYLIVSGAILALHWTAFFQSIQISSVAIGLLTFSTFPIFVTFLEPYISKEKMQRIDLLIALIVIFGVVLVLPSYDISNSVAQGAAWGILSSITFAILSLANRSYAKKYSSRVITFYEMATASIVLVPFLFIERITFTSTNIFLLVVLGLVFTALSHTLFIAGMKHVKAQLASIIATLESVYGIIFAALLLGEIPELRTIIGGAIILAATLYATIKRK